MRGYNQNYGGSTLYIDVSNVVETMEKLKRKLSPPMFETAMQRAFSNTGRKVKGYAKKDIPRKYNMTAGWIGSAVGTPRKNGEMGCLIPIKGSRGTLGATFPAIGGGRSVKGTTIHLKDGSTRKRKGYFRRGDKIQAKILRGTMSTLPAKLPHQGNNPPFRNPSSKLGGVVFTRKTKKPYPIASVSGLGVPQPPINRSEDDLQKDISSYLEKELIRQFNLLMGG